MPDPIRLSLQERQLIADTLQAQNPIARAEIYRRLQPDDEAWIRGALNDPVPPTTAQQIRSGVTTGLETAGRYARDNPVKTGAMVGGIVLPALATGGSSIPAQIALAGLGGAGGAGYGALTGALTGAPEVMQPSMSTIPGVERRVATEGVGQALAATLGHGVGAGMKGMGNIIQRAGLPEDLAKDFPTLAETLNQYWINPTSATGLDWSKTLRKDAAGKARDLVRDYAQGGGAPIVESDLWPRMKGAIKQAREESWIDKASPARGIIRKQVSNLMEAQPLATFPVAPPPYPLQGATSNVIPGSPPTPQTPWWRGWTSNVIPGSPAGPGAAAAGGAGGGPAAWFKNWRVTPTAAAPNAGALAEATLPATAGGELAALPGQTAESQATRAFQPTSPAIAPLQGEIVEPGALGGARLGQPTLQPTGVARRPLDAQIVEPGALPGGPMLTLPGSGEVPVGIGITPRAVAGEPPALQPTTLTIADETAPVISREGQVMSRPEIQYPNNELQPTGLAERGPEITVGEVPPEPGAFPQTGLELSGPRRRLPGTALSTDRVHMAEVVPEEAGPGLFQPTSPVEGGPAMSVVDEGAPPTLGLGAAPPPPQGAMPGVTPPTFGSVGGVPPTAGALPPAGGGSPGMWTPATTRQEPAIPPNRWAGVIRRLQNRGLGALQDQAAQASGTAGIASEGYNNLANAVRQRGNELLPGFAEANARTQQMLGATRAAAKMQNAPTTPKRALAALSVAAPLAGATGYETHSPLETAAAFTAPFLFMSPAATARTAIALYQAGRLPLAELLQVATPELLQRFGLTEAPVADTQGAHDPYAFLDQER